MEKINNVVADSSFYVCFLDCINSPEYLLRIADNFTMHLSPKIFTEITNSPNARIIKENQNKFNIFDHVSFDLGEAVRPLFSKSQVTKGEDEIFVLSYICHNMRIDFILIIDEVSKRKLTLKYIPELKNKLMGTMGFISDCCCKYHIFNKTETLELVDKISCSQFRVTKEIVSEIKNRIQSDP